VLECCSLKLGASSFEGGSLSFEAEVLSAVGKFSSVELDKCSLEGDYPQS